jgi:GNAT superfamily N-acetyltransferase
MSSHSTLTTRPATPADVPALNILIGSAYRGDESRKGWTTEADLLTGPRINDAGILAKMADPNNILLVTMDAANVLVACCEILKRNDELGYFGLFAVDPKRQGGGFGKQVLQAAEKYASQTIGLERLEMQVIWKRAELIAWYIRRGYVLTGEERPFPYEFMVDGAAALYDDLHFVILEKKLS